MFFPSNGFGPDEVRTMTVQQIMAKLSDTIREMQNDEDMVKMSDLTDAEKKKFLAGVEKMLLNGKHVAKLERGTLEGFRAGVLYGLAFALKLAEHSGKMKRLLQKDPEKNLPKAIKVFTLPFTALDEGIANWQNDHWFENFMANAKVAGEKKVTKPKPKKKK
jgi:hypothetical protein